MKLMRGRFYFDFYEKRLVEVTSIGDRMPWATLRSHYPKNQITYVVSLKYATSNLKAIDADN